MKLSFWGTPLKEDEVFMDADTGESDTEDLQTTEPVRLLGGPDSLTTSQRNKLIDRFFDSSVPNKPRMLREVGFTDDEVDALTKNPADSGKAWDAYEKRLNANRMSRWEEEDKRQPHLGLWGYRRRMVKVEDWEPATRDEIVVRVKHFVLSTEADVARLKSEVDRLERFEVDPGATREPISEEVQSFVWRRDGGRCVKCGSQERLEFDHIIPLAKGGSNTERNIQLLCEYHNRLKGAGDPLFGAVPIVRLSDDEP